MRLPCEPSPPIFRAGNYAQQVAVLLLQEACGGGGVDENNGVVAQGELGRAPVMNQAVSGFN